MGAESLRPAPAGFSESQWRAFERDGYLVVPDVLSPGERERYLGAIERVCEGDPEFDPARYYGRENVVELDPVLTELVDHERHVGFAYDLYGDQAKVHMSQIFVRPPRSEVTEWHRDGARIVPYDLFVPRLPLQLKIGYWLTDQMDERAANLVVVPGSHRLEHLDQYTTHEPAPAEKRLCFPAGTMTLMHCSLWHRVAENETASAVRRNLYISYCPSWVTSGDRVRSSASWVAGLTRERRILMRDYEDGYANAKPPPDDVPLFQARAGDADLDGPPYRDVVPIHLRRRRVPIERWL